MLYTGRQYNENRDVSRDRSLLQSARHHSVSAFSHKLTITNLLLLTRTQIKFSETVYAEIVWFCKLTNELAVWPTGLNNLVNEEAKQASVWPMNGQMRRNDRGERLC